MPPRPALLRIPFSHFCRKAEWGLTQAGIAYDAVDLHLWQMRHVPALHAAGTVPVLRVGTGLLTDSSAILAWADAHRVPGAQPLYPPALQAEVAAWEAWAGDAIGPTVRREAYRHLARTPRLGRAYGLPWWMTVGASRRLYVGVLRHYKARRHEAADPPAIGQALARVAARLDATGTGFLFGPGPTAADVATAALLEPMLLVAGPAGCEDDASWPRVRDFVLRVRPRSTTLARRRRGSRRLLQAWAEAARLRA